MEAAQRHDAKTLERLMAKDFTLVHPSQDKVTTRTEWLANLAKVETKQFSYQHLKVVRYGRNLAVASSVFRMDAVMDGRPWPAPKTALIDVWEKRGGRWQVVTRYAVRPGEITVSAPSVAPN
jgi:ketosteroid isomerase-like protein